MRILLDECVDRRLAREIIGHDVTTVHKMGWAGVKNGLRGRSSRLTDLRPLIPGLLAAIPLAAPGSFQIIAGA